MLSASSRDRNPTIEILVILDNTRCMVKRVDHVVDGGALLWDSVGGTEVEPLICSLHLGAGL